MFGRNFGIKKFVYATPFTKDGKAHGEMREQFKRKTFLQVSHTFPYVKTRVNVVRRWEAVLSPLESACEDVKKKTSDLHKAVNLQPPDVRMLQVNLQGAVLTSVNQVSRPRGARQNAVVICFVTGTDGDRQHLPRRDPERAGKVPPLQ